MSNIYREARENAKMTREQAGKALNLSPSSIKAFEEDDLRCCAHVQNMAIVYNAPELPIQHIANVCVVGKACLPQYEKMDTTLALLYLQKSMADVADCSKGMIIHACATAKDKAKTQVDKAADKAEAKVHEMIGASLAYYFSTKKKITECVTTRRSSRSKPAA